MVATVAARALVVVLRCSEKNVPSAAANPRKAAVSIAWAASPNGCKAPVATPRRPCTASIASSQRIPQTAPIILARRMSAPERSVAVRLVQVSPSFSPVTPPAAVAAVPMAARR